MKIKMSGSLLEQYTNQSLPPFQRWLVSLYLTWDDGARSKLQSLAYLKKAVQSQPPIEPSPELFYKIRERIHETQAGMDSSKWPSNGFWNAWVGGMALVILSIILLWTVLPPAITLQWSAQGGELDTFRIYRAEAINGPQNFALVEEISAIPDQQIYTFRDFLLFPGQQYVYRVEVIDQNGASFSQSILSDSIRVLPGQIALIASLILFGYGIIQAIQKPKLSHLQLL